MRFSCSLPLLRQARIERVAKLARGYIYYVSLKGVTGALSLDLRDVANKLVQLRTCISIPIGVGFGIRDSATAKAVAELADAVVIGSRIIEEIENSPREEFIDECIQFGKKLCAYRHGRSQLRNTRHPSLNNL